jgi:hypothetical protein
MDFFWSCHMRQMRLLIQRRAPRHKHGGEMHNPTFHGFATETRPQRPRCSRRLNPTACPSPPPCPRSSKRERRKKEIDGRRKEVSGERKGTENNKKKEERKKERKKHAGPTLTKFAANTHKKAHAPDDTAISALLSNFFFVSPEKKAQAVVHTLIMGESAGLQLSIDGPGLEFPLHPLPDCKNEATECVESCHHLVYF